MKIDKGQFSNLFEVKNKKENHTIPNKINEVGEEGGKDVYQFRIQANELKSLFQKASELEEKESEQWFSIKERIENGTYHVSGSMIINKLQEEG
jgi:anti-sigma28 factor (negative regulator of flagellin synthesis)